MQPMQRRSSNSLPAWQPLKKRRTNTTTNSIRTDYIDIWRLKLRRSHTPSLLPSQLYLDHSLRPLLAPATLAALPSTRAIPDRDVFYVRSSRSLHSALHEANVK